MCTKYINSLRKSFPEFSNREKNQKNQGLLNSYNLFINFKLLYITFSTFCFFKKLILLIQIQEFIENCIKRSLQAYLKKLWTKKTEIEKLNSSKIKD